MTMIRRSPWVPLSIVLACVVASAASSWAVSADDAVELDVLEAAALGEAADAEAWWAYAQGLVVAEREAHALQAIEQVLERAPYHEAARYEKALLLARSGETGVLLAWLEELVYTHPALAAGAFARSELAPYLADERFRALAAEARVQAVD